VRDAEEWRRGKRDVLDGRGRAERDVQAIDGPRTGALRVGAARLRPFERAVVIVRPARELDLHSGLRLVDAVDAIEGSGAALDVCIELGDVAFVDVAGLRALFRCRDVVRSRGGSVSFARPSSAVRRLLSVLPDLRARFEEE
jgi:anti-anti-sigma factor